MIIILDADKISQNPTPPLKSVREINDSRDILNTSKGNL